MVGGEEAFVVVIKPLDGFDGHKLSRLSGWVRFYSIKMNIKERTTECVSSTSKKKLTLMSMTRVKLVEFGKNIEGKLSGAT